MDWGGVDLRASDLFYKGGESVRGFDNSGFGPRDSQTGAALGGTMFAAATAEVRFPIPLVPEELGVSGAVFADAGTLFEVSDRIAELGKTGSLTVQDDTLIRSSVGGSLIWNSPMGPLRADLAYVLSSAVYDDEQMFRFGASTKF